MALVGSNIVSEYFMQRQGLGHFKGKRVDGADGVAKEFWDLRSLSPRLSRFYTAMEKWHKMGELDQQEFDAISDKVPGGFEKLAVVPYEIDALMMQTHPEIADDRSGETLEAWLRTEGGKPFAVPKAARRRHSSVSFRGGFKP